MWLLATQRFFSNCSPLRLGEDVVPIWWAGIFFRVGWLKPPTSHTMTPLLLLGNVGQVAWCHPNPWFLLWEVFLFCVILLDLLDLFVSEEIPLLIWNCKVLDVNFFERRLIWGVILWNDLRFFGDCLQCYLKLREFSYTPKSRFLTGRDLALLPGN